MLSTGRDYVFTASWFGILPGIAILITDLGFSLSGDGLRDFVDLHAKKLRKQGQHRCNVYSETNHDCVRRSNRASIFRERGRTR